MVNFRSHCRNYFVLLALMLLLPCAAVFASSTVSQFTVTVTDEGGTPVENAKVFVYDQNYSYHWSNWHGQATTDSTGKAVVTINVFNTVESTNYPDNNVGILAIPPRNVAESTLAWTHISKTAIWPNPDETAYYYDNTVILKPGVKLTVKPSTKVGETVAPGLFNNARISFPNFPSHEINVLEITDAEIRASPDWVINWPANKMFSLSIYSDGQMTDPTKSSYFAQLDRNINIGNQDVTLEFTHEKSLKGEIEVNVKKDGQIDGQIDPTYQARIYTNTWPYLNQVTENGTGLYYLPYGTYNFSVEPADYQVTDAIALYHQKVVGPEKLVIDYVPAAGIEVGCKITLGTEGDEPGNIDYTSNLYGIVAQKQISDENNNEFWVEYQSSSYSPTKESQSTAVYSFPRKFQPGTYRFYQHSWNSRAVDQSVVPWKSYRLLDETNSQIAVTVDISQNNQPHLIFPQDIGVFARLKSTDSQIYSCMAAIVNNNEMGYGYSADLATYYNYDEQTYYLFAYNVKPEDKVIFRADLPPIFIDDDNHIPEAVKLFPPVVPNATGTKDAGLLEINATDFVNVAGDVTLDGTPRYARQEGVLRVSPMITIGDMQFSASQIGLGNPVQKAFFKDPGFSFRFEKDRNYLFSMKEEVPYGEIIPLDGFAPYEQQHAFSEATNTFVIALEKGGSFKGTLFVSDESGKKTRLADGEQVQVEVKPVAEDYWQDYYQNNTKKGLTSAEPEKAGEFFVSGLKSGKYSVLFNLDGIETDPNNDQVEFKKNYNSQTMPLVEREIFVDATKSDVNLEFNLDSFSLRYVGGQIIDSAGDPVVGLWLQICKKNKDRPWEKGRCVFYCKTDSSGNIVAAAGTSFESPEILLEFGEYDVYAVYIDNFEQLDKKYALSLEEYVYNWGTNIGSINVSPVTPWDEIIMFNAQVGIRYDISSTVKFDGTVVEDYLNFQIYNQSFEYETYAHNHPDENGVWKLQFPEGINPGTHFLQFVKANHEFGGEAKIFLKSFDTIAGPNNFDFDFVPTDLAEKATITCKGSDNQAIPMAYIGLRIVKDAETEWDFPQTFWLGDFRVNAEGLCDIYLPKLPAGLEGYRFQLALNDAQRSEPVYDENGIIVGDRFINYSPDNYSVDIAPGDALNLVWKAPTMVVVEPTVVPNKADHYVGVLMPSHLAGMGFENFLNTLTSGEMYQPPMMNVKANTAMPGMGGSNNVFFAALVDGKFSFNNTIPDQEYVFFAYQALWPVNPYEMEWTRTFNWQALFRHFHGPFFVPQAGLNGESAIKITFRALANLTVETAPENILMKVQDVNLGVTADPTQTTGLPAWPVMMPRLEEYFDDKTYSHKFRPVYDVELPFTDLMVPINYAIRAAVAPATLGGGYSKYTPKIDQNIIVPDANGRKHIMQLRTRTRVSGTFTYNNQPASGIIYLIKDGADPQNENNWIKFEAQNGSYEGYLDAGYFNGYAVPNDFGVSTFVGINVVPDTNATANIFLKDGIEISGSIMDGENPVFGASIRVMRKASSRSTELDGQKFLPYPVIQGNNEIFCNPDGSFFFQAEADVDYYLQPVVSYGYNPGPPRKVSANQEDMILEPYQVSQGLTLSGLSAEPAFVEARPMFENVPGQIGEIQPIFTQADKANASETYPFKLFGLNPGVPYSITLWPNNPEKSFRKFDNIFAGMEGQLPALVEFGAGNVIKGRLVDADKNSIPAQGVNVRLAVTMPMYAMDPNFDPNNPPPPRNLKFKVMANTTMDPSITPPMPVDMFFTNVQEFWTQTDSLGRYEFKSLPQFVSGFISTEQVATANGIEYAVGRTPDFVPEFTETVSSMTKDITLRRGGTIIGRLIDAKGQPITGMWVEAESEEHERWVEAMTDAQGNFTIKGLIPAPNYMLKVWEVPGMAPAFRGGIAVEAGKTTDVGVVSVAKATWVNGKVVGLDKLAARVAADGMLRNTEFFVLGFDNNRVISDNGILTSTFVQHIIGDGEIWIDPFMFAQMPTIPGETPTEMPAMDMYYGMNLRPGNAQLGVLMGQDTAYGETLVSWGWKPNVAVPNEEQMLATDSTSFEMPDLTTPLDFGTIVGTLTHAVETNVVFNKNDAKIAFYPVDDQGVLKPVPFPAALTSAFNNRFMIRDMPVGRYRIKVLTKNYGTIFPDKIYEVKKENTSESPAAIELKIGAGMRQIVGKVVVGESSTPVADARVNLIPSKLITSTDAEGNYSFFLPVGSYFLAQVEVSKVGFETTRVVKFDGIDEKGFLLPAGNDALTLPNIKLSNAVRQLEVNVVDPNNKGLVGAEVTMIVQNKTGTATETRVVDGATTLVEVDTFVYVPAEVQITDESGRAVFKSVPSDKQVSVRARAFYHDPKVAPVATTDNTVQVKLALSKPKVYYRGKITPVTVGDTTTYTLKGNFDFNIPVTISDLNYFFGTDYSPVDLNSSAFTYPDKIGSKIMTMIFDKTGIAEPATDEITGKKSLWAKMYFQGTAAENLIGEFDVFEGTVFRVVKPVDPTAEDGFAARQTDENGNQLPSGITVPPGMLPPEVEQFTMTVAPQTDEPLDVGDNEEEQEKYKDLPEDQKPKLAGPKFKFNFGTAAGESNAAAGTQQQGLFEITIAYDGSTNFEPRWYDAVNKRWSKVGILEESIKVDHPQVGFVTFKVTHLTEFAAVKNIIDSNIGMRCDYNGDSVVDLNDLIYQIAWMQANYSTSAQTVAGRAEEIFPSIKKPSGSLTIPSQIIDDLTGDGKVDLNDLIMLISWIQANKTTDTTTITNRAKEIFPNIVGSPINMPGQKVNR